MSIQSTTQVNGTMHTYCEKLSYYAAHYPKLSLITAIAFSALGITMGITALTAPIVTISSFLLPAVCLSVSTVLFLALVRKLPTHVCTECGFNIPLSHEYLKEVMQETLAACKQDSYTSPNGTTHRINLEPALRSMQLFPDGGSTAPRPGAYRTQISVLSQDCLKVAQNMVGRGLNPLVLDLANEHYPGGGYLLGSNAQEEDICRRSSLAPLIDVNQGVHSTNYYPLNQTHPHAVLYLSDVLVFREGRDQNYQFLDRPFSVAIGVAAAKHYPHLKHDASGRLVLEEATAQLTQERIRTLLEAAYQKGHRSLVLGALGCGAFGNPPDHIAELFLKVIQDHYPNCFQEIAFAILDDKNSGKPHNPEGNFHPFKKRVDAYNRAQPRSS